MIAPRRAGRPEFEAPRPLFTFPIASGDTGGHTFDVTRDGARILALTTPAASRPRQIEIVTDWLSELQHLAPPGGR